MFKKIFILFIMILLGANIGFCEPSKLFSKHSKVVPIDPIFKNTIIIPAGYILPITIPDGISSANMNIADSVTATLKSDFYYNSKLIAPEGSNVLGMVTKNAKSKSGVQLCIKFTSIITPSGQNIPISAIFNTNDKTGILSSTNDVNIAFPQNSSFDIKVMQPITFVSR